MRLPCLWVDVFRINHESASMRFRHGQGVWRSLWAMNDAASSIVISKECLSLPNLFSCLQFVGGWIASVLARHRSAGILCHFVRRLFEEPTDLCAIKDDRGFDSECQQDSVAWYYWGVSRSTSCSLQYSDRQSVRAATEDCCTVLWEIDFHKEAAVYRIVHYLHWECVQKRLHCLLLLSEWNRYQGSGEGG